MADVVDFYNELIKWKSLSDEFLFKAQDAIHNLFIDLSNPTIPMHKEMIVNAPVMNMLIDIYGVDTREFMEKAIEQKDNNKIMFFTNLEFKDKIDAERAYKEDKETASKYINNWMLMTSIYGTDATRKRHLQRLLDKFITRDYVMDCPIYHLSIYYDIDFCLSVRNRINSYCRDEMEMNDFHINNKPEMKNGKHQLAIISDARIASYGVIFKWCKLWLEIFKRNFYVSLIYTATKKNAPLDEAHMQYFDEVIEVSTPDDAIKIQNNGFQFAFFPCQSGTMMSIYLSNLQLCPVMFSGYSHPYPSGKTKMTHLIVSDECESEKSKSIYHEKLLKMSNITTTPLMVDKLKNVSDPYGFEVRIALNYAWLKNDEQMIDILQHIVKSTNRRVKYIIFPGECHDVPLYMTMIEKILKKHGIDNFEINDHQFLTHEKMMEKLAGCQLGIQPLQGGFTCLLENLQASCPTYCIDGDFPQHKQQGVILKTIGMEELFCHDVEEFKHKIEAYINNPHIEERIINKLNDIDLRLVYGGMFEQYSKELMEALNSTL